MPANAVTVHGRWNLATGGDLVRGLVICVTETKRDREKRDKER